MKAVRIADALRGETLFITGATGFLGKVLVEKILWSVPEVGKLLLLVRADDARGAAERLEAEVLSSPIMARLRAHHGEAWQAWAASKVEVVAGDLGQEHFGLDATAYASLCQKVDRVVASAATVTFDERLDRAVELNARGALRTLALARDAGDVPLVHVSTCYVSGRREGSIPERLPEVVEANEPASEQAREPDEILAELDEACRQAGADGDDNGNGTGRSGPDASGAALVATGAAQAARYGFHDVYTLTKALGELLLARERGSVPLAIVRPAIVESALAQPIPGWIEAIRVADPLLVAYGRGRTRELPGAPEVPLELVPVDYVVHTLLAALAELDRSDSGDAIRIYQVASSRNPITLGALMEHARDGFTRTPLYDPDGAPIRLQAARFVEPETLRRRLATRLRRVRRLDGITSRLGERGKKLRTRLGVAARTLEHFTRLIEVYRPYLSPRREGTWYQAEATRELWGGLSEAEKEIFPFDVAAIDWPAYVSRIHVPGLIRFALKAEAPVPTPESAATTRLQARAEAHAAEASTLFELFARVARENPDHLALQTFRDGRWLRYTYGQALTTTANVAWHLAERYGISRGDRVVLWASGCPEWVLVTMAVHRLGAAIVPLDPQWPVAEVAQAARIVEAKLVCLGHQSEPRRPALTAAFEETFGQRTPAVVPPLVTLAAPFVPEPDVGLLPGVRANARASSDISDATANDLASILFTSGTTATVVGNGTLPKAVPLTHANYLANLRDLVPLMCLQRERLLAVLPIHHAFEQMVGLLVPLAGASTISYVAEIKPAEISWMMATTRPTVLVAVPRLLELLHGGIMRSAEASPVLRKLFKVLFALSRLTGARHGHRLFAKVHQRFGGALRRIATGGSALEPSLGRSFQLMGFQVAEGYGMTETSPVITVNPWGQLRFGSVGRPLPGVDVELRPPVDAASVAGDLGAPPGRAAGEIWVRGANVMAGYYRNSAATAEILRDGWLNTGDIGYFDADGYLYISGRTKDVIVTAAGKNVYPEEVELRYRGIPSVEELVVLGLPRRGQELPAASSSPSTASTARGEVVVAVVVPRPGAGYDELEGIRAAIDARSAEVPSYQRITRVEIWRGDLPKTTTLKVKRAALREAVLAGERGPGEAGASVPAEAPAAEPTRGTAPPSNGLPPNPAETWVLATLARLTRTRPDLLSPTDRLADLGVDSLTQVELVGELEAHLGRRLDDAAVAELSRVRDVVDLV